MKKKVNYNEELSPNFSKRNDKIKYIIIHYTGTKSLLEALKIFKGEDALTKDGSRPKNLQSR